MNNVPLPFKRCCWALRPFATVLLVLAAIAWPGRALARESTAPVGAPISPAATGVPVSSYRLPSAQARFHQYLRDAYGPGAMIAAAVFGGLDQSRNAPPEWKQGGEGFAKRYGSNFGVGAITETARYGLASALRVDTKYYRCACTGALPRLGHALLSGATSHRADGGRVVSVPNFVAPYAGGLAATAAWYPNRFGPKDGLRLGTISLGIHAGLNVIWEFLPSRR